MFSRAATRTTTTLVSRRGFHATRARLSSPYHYPEGPYSNLPFNPRKKGFAFGYWGFIATGFFAPFGIAGESCRPSCFFFALGLGEYHVLTRLIVYQTYKSAP